MKIFIKQVAGSSIELEVSENLKIITLIKMTYDQRNAAQKNATFENYLISLNLTFATRKLDLDKCLRDYYINEGCTIIEIPKNFTMAPGFDWATLSIQDPVSLETIKDPYMLNPGCLHAFDKSTLQLWIRVKTAKQETPNCPCCRTEIKTPHLFALMFFTNQSSRQDQEQDSLDRAASRNNIRRPGGWL